TLPPPHPPTPFPYTPLFRSAQVLRTGSPSSPSRRGLAKGPHPPRTTGLPHRRSVQGYCPRRSSGRQRDRQGPLGYAEACPCRIRSEEHTSELQSREKLVCRL